MHTPFNFRLFIKLRGGKSAKGLLSRKLRVFLLFNKGLKVHVELRVGEMIDRQDLLGLTIELYFRHVLFDRV